MKNRNALRNVLGILLWAGLSSAAIAQGKPDIRVAIEGAYPPFNYIDQNNDLQGFEVDLLNAMCSAMEAKCTPVQHEWDGIIRGLINGEYDAIMSSLEITEKRQGRIAFSQPYYRVPVVFVAAKTADFKEVTPKALAGLRIGTNDRSEQATYLEKHFRESEIKTYSKLEEANLDLLTERLDLVLGDKFALTKFLDSREGGCCRIVSSVPNDPPYRFQSYGIGIRKEDAALKDTFDKALQHIVADGTYDRIREKYFPFDIK